MSDQIYSHILLSQALCFANGKIRSEEKSEKSKFLSSLALLLNGDASCTAVYVHLQEKTVLIARNEAVSHEDQRYFDRFFSLMRIYSSVCFDRNFTKTSTDAYQLLSSLVYEYNARKIIKRFSSSKNVIVDRLKKFVHSNPDHTRFIHELQSNSKVYREKPTTTEKIDLISKNRSVESYVEYIFSSIDRFLLAYDKLIENRNNFADEHIDHAVCFGQLLYQSRLFLFILTTLDDGTSAGEYYFEKISAHGRSLNLILKCLFKRKDDLAMIYKQITWKLIPSMEQQITLNVIPKQACQSLFDKFASSRASKNVEEPNFDDFYREHSSPLQLHDKNRFVSMHRHAEILLVDYLLTNEINETHGVKEIEIGISKLPCLLCSFYVKELNEKYNRCFFSSNSSNGKIYGKWLLRETEDSSIIESIDRKLVDKLEHAIQKLYLNSERSGPKKSGDSDTMYTSIEEDQFDQFWSSRTELIGVSSTKTN